MRSPLALATDIPNYITELRDRQTEGAAFDPKRKFVTLRSGRSGGFPSETRAQPREADIIPSPVGDLLQPVDTLANIRCESEPPGLPAVGCCSQGMPSATVFDTVAAGGRRPCAAIPGARR